MGFWLSWEQADAVLYLTQLLQEEGNCQGMLGAESLINAVKTTVPVWALSRDVRGQMPVHLSSVELVDTAV